jgi:putative ABC transport system permease protein
MVSAFARAFARMVAFFRPAPLDCELDEELQSHLEMLVANNVRRGQSPEDAARNARMRIGNVAALKERHRDVRGLPAIDSLWQDLRYALRLIGRERWYSMVAIGALALGIGLNALGFTIVNAAFLRNLPFDEPDRIYTLSWNNRSNRRTNLSQMELQEWRAQSRTIPEMAGYLRSAMNVSDDQSLPEAVRGAFITANAFSVLRQPPLLGRRLTPADGAPDAERVVALGAAVWRTRYAADPNVLGKTIRINGRTATIIAVMPDGMRFPDGSDLWVPVVSGTGNAQNDLRTARDLTVFGRLADGVSQRQAHAELNGIAQQLIKAYPDAYRDVVGARVETFNERFIGGPGRVMFLAMMGAVTLVLLIACANVANLLLSRSVQRGREIAMRVAVGATRRRVIRQLLIESLVLGLMGAGLGLLIAIAGAKLFDAAFPDSELLFWIKFTTDHVVFAYVAALGVLTAVLFGLAPALHVSKTNTYEVLKDGGRGQTGSPRLRWLSTSIVVAQVTLAVLLLTGAGLMARTFIKHYQMDLGIDLDRVMTMRVRLPASSYPDANARRSFFEQLEPRLAAIPGLEAVALTTAVPPHDGGERLLEVDRPIGSTPERPRFVSIVVVSPRFFDVMEVPAQRGRLFTQSDGAQGLETVVINRMLAEQFFPGEDPIGRRIRFTQRDATPDRPPDVWRTIVGITPTVLTGSPQDGYVNAVVYIPYRQEAPEAANLLIRSALPAESVIDAVRRQVQAIDRDQPVDTIQTVRQQLAEDRWVYRLFGGFFTAFAIIALLLAAVDLYAVMAYSVSRRTQEIGVRMAVGAMGRQVWWLVLKQGLKQVVVGLTLGLVGSVPLTGILESMLRTRGNDPMMFAAVTTLLLLVALGACVIPAYRATRVDPLTALRAD